MTDQLSKTEQELVEKINHILYEFSTLRIGYQEARDQILALIKEAFPELAKEASYVKLADDQTFPSGIRAIEKTLRDRGWRKVKLG